MPVPTAQHSVSPLVDAQEQPARVSLYLASVLVLAVFAAAITVYGHLAGNARIYAFFSRLSNAGVDIFNPPALPHWGIPWQYLDFTPFNLLIYKLLFWSPGRFGEMIFRAYQFSYLFLGLYCIRQPAKDHLLTKPQELSRIALTAFNLPLQLLIIYSADFPHPGDQTLLRLHSLDLPAGVPHPTQPDSCSAWAGAAGLHQPQSCHAPDQCAAGKRVDHDRGEPRIQFSDQVEESLGRAEGCSHKA